MDIDFAMLLHSFISRCSASLQAMNKSRTSWDAVIKNRLLGFPILLVLALFWSFDVDAAIIVDAEESIGSRVETLDDGSVITILNFEATVAEGLLGIGVDNSAVRILGDDTSIAITLTEDDTRIGNLNLPLGDDGNPVLDFALNSTANGLELVLYLANGRSFDFEDLGDNPAIYTIELEGDDGTQATGSVVRIDISLTVANVDEGIPEIRSAQNFYVYEDAVEGTGRAIVGIPVQVRNNSEAVIDSIDVLGVADVITDFRIGSIVPLNAVGEMQAAIGSDNNPDLAFDDKPFAIDSDGRITVKAVNGDLSPLDYDLFPAYMVYVQARDNFPDDVWGEFAEVMINVRQVIEPPSINITSISVAEGILAGSRIGFPLPAEGATVFRIIQVIPDGFVVPIQGVTGPFAINNAGQIIFTPQGDILDLNREEYSRFSLLVQAGREENGNIVWGPSSIINVILDDIDETPDIEDQQVEPISQITGALGGSSFGDAIIVANEGDSQGRTGTMELQYAIDRTVSGHTQNAEITFGIDASTGVLFVREGQVTAVGVYQIGVRVTDFNVDSVDAINDVSDIDTALLMLQVTPDEAPFFSAEQALIQMPDTTPDDEGEIGPRIVAAETDGEELTYAITAVSVPRQIAVSALPFEINPASGQITVETTDRTLNIDATYTFTVTSTDATGTQEKSDSIEVTIARDIFDNRPEIITPRSLMVPEDIVGDVGIPLLFRDDYGDIATKWEITGIKAGDVSGREVTPVPLEIDINGQLQIVTGQRLFYSRLPQDAGYYTLTLVVTTLSGINSAGELESMPVNMRIYVSDVDESPEFAEETYNLSISDPSNGDSVGQIVAVDSLARTVSYAIDRVIEPVLTVDNLPFVISNEITDAGELIVAIDANRELSDSIDDYIFIVSATSAGGVSTVRVEVNTNPNKPDIVGPLVLMFEENSRVAAESLVARLDLGELANLEWSLLPSEDGEDNPYFTITSAGQEPGMALLELREGVEPFNFEDNVLIDNKITVMVQVCNEGLCDTESIIVEIIDIDEAPVFANAPIEVLIIPENVPTGFAVGAPITVSDEDGEALIYTLAETTEPFFINAFTGQILVSLVDAESLDFETRESYEVTVIATEAQGLEGTRVLSAEINVVIRIRNVNDEIPVVTAGQVLEIGAGVDDETLVGLVLVEDADGPDINSTFIYSATPIQSASTPFKIDANTGIVTVELESGVLPQTPSEYTLTVTVRDLAGNLSIPTPVRIQVIGSSNVQQRQNEIGLFSRVTATMTTSLLLDSLRPQLRLIDRGAVKQARVIDLTAEIAKNWGTHKQYLPEAKQLLAGLNWQHNLQDSKPYNSKDTGSNSYTVWLRSGQKNVDASASLEHGQVDYEGDSWAVTAGLERYLGNKSLVGILVNYNESSLGYKISPTIGLDTEGVYQEDGRFFGVYGAYRPQVKLRFWSVLGGGLGRVFDSRVTAVSSETATAPFTQFLGAMGAEYGLVVGPEPLQFELIFRASGYGLSKTTDILRYQGGTDSLVVAKTKESLFELRTGLRVGLPISLNWLGNLKFYLGLDWLYNPGGYYLQDEDAFDLIGGFELHGKRLLINFEGNYETGRASQSLWGAHGEIRYMLLPGKSGLAFSITGNYGATGLLRGSNIDTSGLFDSLQTLQTNQKDDFMNLRLESSYGIFDPKRDAHWTVYAQSESDLFSLDRKNIFSLGLRFEPEKNTWQADLKILNRFESNLINDTGMGVKLNFTKNL